MEKSLNKTLSSIYTDISDLISPMASSSSVTFFPDIWAWMRNLPPLNQWKNDTMSMNFCCPSPSQPSLKLSITQNPKSSSLSVSMLADFNLSVPLWTSKPLKMNFKITNIVDQDVFSNLLANFIQDILNYCPNRNNSFLKIPTLNSLNHFKDFFNISFLTLTFLLCIYEAPADLRVRCLNTIKNQLAFPFSREVTNLFVRLLGPDLEEQWMRSINLAITNWIVELKATNHNIRTPSPLFSYSLSRAGLWKVQLYCPVIAMDLEKSTDPTHDERLWFSLIYHQLEGVIQFNHKAILQDKWIEVIVNVDNIRFDVIQLLTERLMNERGAGTEEKHFPSRVSLQLTPALQVDIMSVSVRKSSANPTREIALEESHEISFAPPNSVGLRYSAAESTTVNLKPWKFEQSVHGASACLNWFLHDSTNGREVFSSEPSRKALLQRKAWFKHRYSNVNRPFTREGGIIFAHDEYGENVVWKVNKSSYGKRMEWEIKGWIWLTYWPHKHRTSYTETRRLEIRENLCFTLP